MSTKAGFVQAQSDNLPKIDAISMFAFLGNNPNFMGVELKGVKVAIGGCKHAVALLTWVHKRSEEQPKTSIDCYWKKSVLSNVGTNLKLMKAEDLGKAHPLQPSNDTSFLQSFVNHSLDLGTTDTVLLKYFKEDSNFEKLSLYRSLEDFMMESADITVDAFFTFCTEQMTEDICRDITMLTVEQTESALWHELRYLRVTASEAYDVAYCKTTAGSLVESVLGASKLKDTAAMDRGRQLEEEVLKIVEKQTGRKIEETFMQKKTLCNFLM